MDRSLVTTTFTLEGYRVVRHLGVVRGITVRSRSVVGTIGASLQTLVGAASLLPGGGRGASGSRTAART